MTAGGSCYALYVVESAYATAGTPTLKFGQGVKISGIELNNNGGLKWGVGGFEAGTSFVGKGGGKFSLEFNPYLDWSWMAACLGGSGPYSVATLPKSLTVLIGYGCDTAYTEKYSGVIIKSCKVTIEVGDNPVTVSLDCEFADVDTTTAYSSASLGVGTDSVWSFGQGSVSVAGTSYTLVERVEITINRNPNAQWGIGSRKSAALWFGQAQYDLHMVNYLTDKTKFMATVLGGTAIGATVAEVATINILLTQASTSVTFAFTGVYPQTISKNVEVENGVLEDITVLPRGLTVTVDATP